MKSVAAILLLACAVSGQIIGSPLLGLNRAWNGVPLGLNGASLAYGAPMIGSQMIGSQMIGSQMIASAPMITRTAPVVAAAPIVAPAPMLTSSQYHSQDELGQASFGYAHPGQASSNFRDAYGNQVGSYAYINPEGKEVKVSYVADSLGFRVLSNDLPIAPVAAPVASLPMPLPVADTVEVVEARNAHMAAIAAAKSGAVAVPVMIGEAPKPVEDTPEVAAAKAEHLAAKAAISSRQKRQIALASPLMTGAWLNRGLPAATMLSAPLAYSAPMMAAPLAYSAPIMSAPATVISAPATREATLTNIVHTPGHAMSYRVD